MGVSAQTYTGAFRDSASRQWQERLCCGRSPTFTTWDTSNRACRAVNGVRAGGNGWHKDILGMGADADLHLRKSVTAVSRGSSVEEDKGHRFLHERTFSTVALLHVLARASAASRGSKDKNAEQIQSWAMVGTAILRRLLHRLGVINHCIFLDSAVETRVGLPCSGDEACRIVITDSCIDLTPVAACEHRALRHTVAALRERTDVHQMPVLSALSLLYGLGSKSKWLYTQILFGVSNLLE
eukprot:3236047-Amphidinium_carterae.1